MNDFFRFRRQGCHRGLSGKDFMFRLPATFCKIKVSGSKTVGGCNGFDQFSLDRYAHGEGIYLAGIHLQKSPFELESSNHFAGNPSIGRLPLPHRNILSLHCMLVQLQLTQMGSS